jgi:hypothetical protein
MPEIPCAEVRDSSFGEFRAVACAFERPDPATVVGIPLWGITWPCSVADGRVVQVQILGRWQPARATLRDSICDALELAYAEMPA